MVGWFDAVEKGNALRFGGFDWLVINKLDALSRTREDFDHQNLRYMKILMEIEQPLYQGPKAKV